jgi:hypothetical protein
MGATTQRELEMNPNVKFIVNNFSACACILCAAYMAVHNVSGWGWFLLIAVLI